MLGGVVVVEEWRTRGGVGERVRVKVVGAFSVSRQKVALDGSD